MSYKFLEHTADIKFQAFGETIEEVFKEAAMALKETMTKGVKIKSIKEKSFSIDGKDKESLMRNFLEEFLFFLDADFFMFSEIKEIEINGNILHCVVLGDDAVNYQISNDVKAITYNEMYVEEKECQVVLDV